MSSITFGISALGDLDYPELGMPSVKRTERWKTNPNIPPGLTGPGCALGCIYCNQQYLDTEETGVPTAGYLYSGIALGISINPILAIGSCISHTITLNEIIDELENYPYYTPNSSVVIGNFHDPGLWWNEAISLGELLVKEFNHAGPIHYITKMPIPDKYVEQMKKLQEMGGKPIVIVTYSNLPREIEPASGDKRVETMRKLANVGVPVILSMRPMIEGINTSDESITYVAQTAGKYANAITVGGLHVYPETKEVFEKAGFQLSRRYTAYLPPWDKFMPPETLKKIRKIMVEQGVNVTVHKYSSCASAEIMTTFYNVPWADRIAHWATTKIMFEECYGYCDDRQISVCEEAANRNPDEVIMLAQQALGRIGHNEYNLVISDLNKHKLLVKDGAFTYEELYPLMEACGWRVSNWLNYKGLEHRIKQTLNEDLGLSEDIFLGAIPMGQEWLVFVSGNSDGLVPFLVERHLRDRGRQRLYVHDVSDFNSESIQDLAHYIIKVNGGKFTLDETVEKITQMKNQSDGFLEK